MLRTKLFRQHYGITVAIMVLFVFLGIAANFIMVRVLHPPPVMGPPIFFARLVDRVGFIELRSMIDKDVPFELALIDGSGKVLAPESYALPFDWDSVPHPTKRYTYQGVGKNNGPAPFPEQLLIRLDGEPARYLFIHMKGNPPRPTFGIVTAAISVLIFSILVGAGLALLVLFRSLHKRAALADSVISELQRGNLKARVPIKRMDEIGEAMSRFNVMAEEIERLVERVKSVEKSRMTLLQELAHDLRTPIASLKNLVDTLHSRNNSLAPKAREELLLLAMHEVDYFERLVEDLLILAQVSEPHYQADRKPIFINDLVDDESESMAARYGSGDKIIALRKTIPDGGIKVLGDTHLLRRMFRNALANAFSFAQSEVSIIVEKKPSGEVSIQIDDDGPGMSKDALTSFGERRVSRVLATDHASKKSGRLSVGLGSVIMKTVARIHRGNILVSNRLDESGRVLGARVSISLLEQA